MTLTKRQNVVKDFYTVYEIFYRNFSENSRLLRWKKVIIINRKGINKDGLEWRR